MATWAIIAIVVVAAVIVIAAVAFTMLTRRHRLQQQFGPEYDRMVETQNSRMKAEAELRGRERRVRDLDIRPLSRAAREQYAAEWATLQEQFVDMPQPAVADAYILVTAVMKDRGYPTDDFDQVIADLSVQHASMLDHLRSAHEISSRASDGEATTEDLRQAMIHYRAMFGDLLGSPGEPAEAELAAGRHVAEDRTIGADADVEAGDRAVDDQPGTGTQAPETPGGRHAAPDGMAEGTPGPAADGMPAGEQAGTTIPPQRR